MKKANERRLFRMPTGPALVIIAVLLPILAYAVGAVVDPSGYLSSNPVIIIYPFLFFGLDISHGPIVLLMLGVLVLLAVKYRNKMRRAAKVLIPVFFALSLIYSIWLLIAVSTAPENEFTD